MTFLKHDPSTFATAAADAFADIHAKLVRRVPGGVARASRSHDDQVAVVIGGGSGHYPAFAGLVGPGLAHGAVLGNIFASPSSSQVVSVTRAVEQGRGALLSYGNYAGDCLQFDAAADRLEAEGIRVRTVRVTDDISSAPVGQEERRRGIAGDLAVFKIAGASAARGDDLEAVQALAISANENTRTLGVAFTGCSLPGADGSLFEVPEGQMAIGLGIHGEPGLRAAPVPTPTELASLLVSALLLEAPGCPHATGKRAVVLVNGLGAFKADEMFVLYGAVAHQLAIADITVVDVQVGEFCTSFEMGGVSLTLLWVDAELEELWFSPAVSPGYSTSARLDDDLIAVHPDTQPSAPNQDTFEEATAESRAMSGILAEAFDVVAATVDKHMDELGRIDSIAGDGDHGIGMHNGSTSAAEVARALATEGIGAGTLLRRAGEAWSDGAGGTSGALWSTMLSAVGRALGDSAGFDPQSLRDGVRAACAAVQAQGGAEVGDKTMVDAIRPFADELNADDTLPFAVSTAAAVGAALAGAEATRDMLPGLGRSRTHGERAIGVPDPGAISFALIVDALHRHFTTTTD